MKIIYWTLAIVLAGVLVSLSVCQPTILAHNDFLKGFINQEIVSIMAVMMTISITSIATIHIWFNELEDKHGKKVFGAARREINQTAYYFIGLFVAQLACLIIRSLPIFAGSDIAMSLFNSLSLMLLMCSVLSLVDIMGVVRALTPSD
ncbi:putative integral membrane protein [Bradyrhizobium sp. LB9.1b]